ncbi:alpha/beta hydrolase [Algoriphagus sp. H41]|uniref:Alpha/beta hydrolase n=1 Tax=Algoriphagus oliviformis TaxID=2811231 RepID=A0ABS3C672_9BACT|nr:alpha/beta hydrolase [Algoriphagus oliviformis]MBN7812607.1 alpha/beta hydrolase [Algoriphagus oliviformis]
MKKPILTLILALMAAFAHAQVQILPLWEGTPPLQTQMDLQEEVVYQDIIRIANVQAPTIEVYLPSKQLSTGQAVVIFPGGGYGILAYDKEGTDFAKWLNAQGIAGIVVKYRLPISKSLTDAKEVPLMDAQRAIRLVRQNAAAWNIAPDKVGVLGFSAGGHLASTLSTQYAHEVERPKDAVDALSARPDFSILAYPVISFRDAAVHAGSRKNLIGENPSQELLDRFSGELNVNAQTPPTFLVHAQDDKGVPIENSLLFYSALHKNGVKASLHIYPTGGHGFGFGLGKGSVETWRDTLLVWMHEL